MRVVGESLGGEKIRRGKLLGNGWNVVGKSLVGCRGGGSSLDFGWL